MVSILYIGNKLSRKSGNLASIEVLGPLLEREGYDLQYASSKSNQGIRLLDMLWTCIKYRKSVDVVLIDTYSTLNFWYAFFVSQLCSILKLKYVPLLHGGNLPHRLQQNPKICGLIFNNAYKNTVPSLYLKQAFENYGYKNMIHIPNALDINQYPFELRQFNTVNLLWVRSFSKIYNPNLAVKILKSLQDHGMGASLCMVGPDSDGSLVEAKALAQELGVTVKFTGKLTKESWITLSKDYNIFINTTHFDNMPVSVMEGMALGLPVISTHVGGMPFLIEHEKNGILVEPDCVDAFVNAIKTIQSNPDMASQIAMQARKTVEQFDWEVIKKRWFSVLQ